MGGRSWWPIATIGRGKGRISMMNDRSKLGTAGLVVLLVGAVIALVVGGVRFARESAAPTAAQGRTGATAKASNAATRRDESTGAQAVAQPPAIGDPGPAFLLPPLPAAIADRGKESVTDALIRLGGDARRGSPQAAYDAFLIADFCAQRRRLEGLVTSVGRDREGRTLVRDMVVASLDRVVKVCGDVPPALLDERFAHIRAAAQAGVKGAAEGYFLAGPRGIPLELVVELRDEPQVVAWRNAAIAYFTRDAESGDANAMGRLAEIYSDGKFWPRNPKLALAYHLATIEAVQRSDRPYNEGLLAIQRQRAESMGRELSSAERQAAVDFSEDLIRRCCPRSGKAS